MTATWLPFLFPVAQEQLPFRWLPILGSVLLSIGLLWSLWSLRTLGRSFSVLAQARKVIRSGPYAVVRHPLYFGELVAALGVVLLTPSLGTALLWLALAGLQVFRMQHQEAVLEENLDDYANYRFTTRRLVPGLY